MNKIGNIALVHDYLNQYGGAERCLEVLHDMFPQAPIYTLVYDKKTLPQYQSWDIRPSFLNDFPGMKKQYRYYMPLFPAVVKTFNLQGYDLILSISHAWVKGVPTCGVPHVSYCLTPIRFIWDLYEEYMACENISWIVRKSFPLLARFLRKWDKKQGQKVDHLIAISDVVRRRIAEYYHRTADIIYPPVNTVFFSLDESIRRKNFYMTVSRLKSYKRIDMIIDAFNTLGYPLCVVGTGPELSRLQKKAGENISFYPHFSDEEVRTLYQQAKGFVYAACEDFGIVLAEAQSTGLPVIAYGRGGACEIVEEGVSGILYDDHSVSGIIDAIKKFETMYFDPVNVRKAALRFDVSIFKEKMKTFLQECIKKKD